MINGNFVSHIVRMQTTGRFTSLEKWRTPANENLHRLAACVVYVSVTAPSSCGAARTVCRGSARRLLGSTSQPRIVLRL